MTNIILCGGSGTRLWPISRTLMPKQSVKMFDNQSLFQLAIQRNSNICDSQFIVSNTEQYFLALDQLEELDKINNHYLLEPIGRNTAPAIALACLALDYDEIVLVTPSDHLIKDQKEYENVLSKAKKLATKNNLVTFGITPTFHETGFGYIEAIREDIKAFHEKSDIVKVIPSDISWSNVGSFDALYDELKKDENNNTINDNHISIDSKNNLVFGDDRIIATIDVEDKKYYVRPNESTYIKMGEIHRLENEGKIPVVLIEAQVGEYTGEDDFKRAK